MHDTMNLGLWVGTNKLESGAKICAFIEVLEDYALLLKGTSWGSEYSMKPPAVLTR